MSCRLISFFDVKCFVRDLFREFFRGYRLRGISKDVEYKHRGMVLGSRIFWISCLEMLETSTLGLGQDLGLLSVKVYAVTSRLSFFLLRFLPDSHRFKVRDMFSAYMTCMVRIEHLLRINWKC